MLQPDQLKQSCGIPPMGDLLRASGGLKRDQTLREHGTFNFRFNRNYYLVLFEK